MLLATLVLAADPAPTGAANPALDLIGTFGGYGLVGAILIAVIFRIKIMPTYVHDDAMAVANATIAAKDAEIAALRDETRDLNAVVRERAIPALTRALDAERDREERGRGTQASRPIGRRRVMPMQCSTDLAQRTQDLVNEARDLAAQLVVTVDRLDQLVRVQQDLDDVTEEQ